MPIRTGDVTGMLASWQNGDRAALDCLLPLIHNELHRLARRHLGRERKNHTMQPSSLVQEAFLRLLPGIGAGWRNRAHFIAVASRVIRHVLVGSRVRNGAQNGEALRFTFPLIAPWSSLLNKSGRL